VEGFQAEPFLEGFQAEPFSLSAKSNMAISMEQLWNDTDRGKSIGDWRSARQYSVPLREHILHCKIQAINVFFYRKVSVYGDV
jgi:hypothetical protein